MVISRAASRPFLPVSAPPGVPAEHFPQNPRINTFITMNEFANKGGTGHCPYRPATRRTERVRRSICQRTPFVIGASSFFRHSTFVIRHCQTEIIKNRRNITFYALKPHPTMTQRIVANPWAVGRVTPCAPLLTSKRTSFLQPPPSQCFTLKKHIMQVPGFTICYARSQSAPQRGEGLRVRGGHIQSRLPSVSSCISPTRGPG